MANKKPKYHFEGKRKDANGKDVYVLVEIKTKKQIEVDQETFVNKEAVGEIER